MTVNGRHVGNSPARRLPRTRLTIKRRQDTGQGPGEGEGHGGVSDTDRRIAASQIDLHFVKKFSSVHCIFGTPGWGSGGQRSSMQAPVTESSSPPCLPRGSVLSGATCFRLVWHPAPLPTFWAVPHQAILRWSQLELGHAISSPQGP